MRKARERLLWRNRIERGAKLGRLGFTTAFAPTGHERGRERNERGRAESRVEERTMTAGRVHGGAEYRCGRFTPSGMTSRKDGTLASSASLDGRAKKHL